MRAKDVDEGLVFEVLHRLPMSKPATASDVRAALIAVIPLVQAAEREACRREAVAVAHQFEQDDPRHETGWAIADILRARNPA